MPRRAPQQRRAVATVDAIMDAVVRIAKRSGVDAVTTNRIAEVAGVSVGSVYQYFPDKRAIFVALHDRHVEQIGRLVESTLVAHADASLEVMLRALLEALIDAHAPDPELYALLDAELPHRGAGAESLRGALQLAIASHMPAKRRDLERTLFVVTHMIDAFAHGVVAGRPRGLSIAAAKDEAVRAILAYLRA
ncbi:MAG TPA: TetR/AcrR family transcriptional regulator [Kofleriaceae bacterium]|jgi:AcrR family transcriptional regulator